MPLSIEERERRKFEYAKRALRVMHGYWGEYCAMPSLSELTERMGMHAKSWAKTCVDRLVASEHIERLPSGRMVPGRRFFEEI